MAKCRKCGKKGLFFKVNADGKCNECERIEIEDLEKKRLNRLWETTNIEQDREQPTDTPKFDILDSDTWDYASPSQEMIWNGNRLLNTDGNPNTEKDVVELARSIFKFLERDGNVFPLDKKIAAVTTMLNKMENPAYYAQLEEQRKEEFDNSIPDGLFDPRNPETYKFAKHNKRLVIDGITIFNTHTAVNGKEIKEYETERGFVDVLSLSMKISGRGRKWERSINLVKAEFAKQGIEKPNDHTPGYVVRINEVYQSLLLDDTEEDAEEAEKFDQEYGKKYIENHIKQKIAECAPKKRAKRTRFGGYGFTEAQIEVLDGIPPENIIKIGEIMSAGKNKGSSMLKQEIFNSLGIDGHWVVTLHGADKWPDLEEETMYDYFLGYEFEEEEEMYDFFNSNQYLKKHPEMREELIERMLEYTFRYNDNTEEGSAPCDYSILWDKIPHNVKSLLYFSEEMPPLPTQRGTNIKADGSFPDMKISLTEEFSGNAQHDPSTIYFPLPISTPSKDSDVPPPARNPAYRELTAEQRYVYLSWLQDIARHAYEGYRFLFLSGLERQMLTGDFDAAWNMILKLRADALGCYFFLPASTNSLFTACIMNRTDLFHKMAYLYDELPWNDMQILAKHYTRNPISPVEALGLIKVKNKRYIENFPTEYAEEMEKLLVEKTGQPFILANDFISEENKRHSQIRLGFQNHSFPDELQCLYILLPYTGKLTAFLNELHIECHERTKIRLRKKRSKSSLS